MPSKTEEYLALAQRTANGLTRYWENWTDYLTTASRLYKYSFADQLMIYAQRPDATACASFDIWNNRMNRYVRRGSKGIALLDQSSSVPRLHYVFDVSDTGVRRNSRDPEVWQLGPDLVQPVSEMIAREYGVYHERLSQQISDLTGKLVDSYWDNNSGDILDIVDGSFLIDYDEAGQEFQFKSAAAISILYTVLERCGLEPDGHFDRDDFQAIFSFSTPAAVYALGTAVSECSRDVLRNIERTVKTTIRRRNVERSQYEYEQQERDLLDRRGLPAPEPDPAPAGESTGQIRQTAPDLPDEASPGAVQFDAPVGDSASAPVGSGTDRREPDAADHAGTAETEPGSEQRAASDGVGAAHEQPESTGRGTGDERADLQLSFFDVAIPTEAEQIESIDQAESEKSPSAFVLSQAEIENALRRGSNFEDSKLRISGTAKRKEAFTTAEVAHLMKVLPDDRMGLSIRLLLGTGMRMQELLALEPQFIEEDGSVIHIRQAVKVVKGTVSIGSPKSKDSIRDIPVPLNVRPCAIKLRDTTDQFIWESPKTGLPCNPTHFRDVFRKSLEEAGDVRLLTPHSCRHTYVSQMQALGVDIQTIQSIVGHADTEMTEHYLHVQESIRQSAIQLFSEAFSA